MHITNRFDLYIWGGRERERSGHVRADGVMSDPFAVTLRETAPIEGQKPGTSGLRKKTRTFMEVSTLPAF